MFNNDITKTRAVQNFKLACETLCGLLT